MENVKSSIVEKMNSELTEDHKRLHTASGLRSPNDHEVLQNHSLYNIIFSSVLNLIEGPEIVIVPEGPLFLVPFAALQDGSGKYLSETVRNTHRLTIILTLAHSLWEIQRLVV